MNRADLVKAADDYLAANAAESGADELIRVMVDFLRSSVVVAPELYETPKVFRATQERAPASVIDRLENFYQFECEAGPLKNCVEWQKLKSAIETATAALNKTKAEFRTAGKPAGYVGDIYVDTALAALRGD